MLAGWSCCTKLYHVTILPHYKLSQSGLAQPACHLYATCVTDQPRFLDALQGCYPGVRGGWVERLPGVPISGGRDEAMRTLRPYHEAAVAAFGSHPQPWWRAEQVHGSAVACVPDAAQILAPDGLPVVPGVDGLITNQPGQVLAIYVADCAAIWLADRVSGAIGLLHSGKQGTAGGILENALALMAQTFGTRPGDVTALLSPCIRPPDYEVDFAAQIARQAARAGVGEYYDSGANTAADISRFYSYRIEKGQTGRMLALAVRDCSP
ncbi:MAG: polyphenol oxidase family protein [Verrucomicrobia bacterium]|nr:MAG: polyphenol oxidase family protein [Verrucomicrobiota bacterium]